MRDFFVYIITNKNKTTLCIGVTNSLERRIWEHRNKIQKGFASDYNPSLLLYYESYSEPEQAIAREKQLKGWRREKKVKLIERENPRWIDLSRDWPI